MSARPRPGGTNPTVMHTARLCLRLLDARDAALYRALYTCPQVMRRIMPPMTVDAADAAFVGACRHNTRDAPGHRFWVIEHRSGEAMGIAALRREGGRAELGVMLVLGWQHRGISSEAFVPVLRYGFETMGLEEVFAQRPEDEHALVIDRLLGRFGFERTIAADVPQDCCRWRLSAGHWGRNAGGARL